MDQSWRIEGQQEESEDVETTLTRKLERVQISRSGSASSGSNGSAADFPTDNTRSNTTEHEFGSREGNDEDEDEDAVEEWELALDNSDEDAIPKAPAPSTKAGNKASVAAATSPSKIGNWSDVINDDMYILELYDFAPTIRTIHLTELFALFENRSGGFRIKWIDDSRALVIFESSAIAKQAYTANSSCPIARIRPYTGADKDAIRNEGKLANPAFNAPRPQKTDSVAKRLVHGALGLRVRRTPEQIAEEKALVKAAKEAREAQRQEQKRLQEERDAMFNS
ncbi:R3H and coiled-coil domain-containing protein 1 [Podila humilis]|nr:R3H and coiled-coil domain-containing protein 1 [Podila humilis]